MKQVQTNNPTEPHVCHSLFRNKLNVLSLNLILTSFVLISDLKYLPVILLFQFATYSFRRNSFSSFLSNAITVTLFTLIALGVAANNFSFELFSESVLRIIFVCASVILSGMVWRKKDSTPSTFPKILSGPDFLRESFLSVIPLLLFVWTRVSTDYPFSLKFLISGWDRYGGHSQVIAAILDEGGAMDYTNPANASSTLARVLHMAWSTFFYLAGWEVLEPSERARLYFNSNWAYELLVVLLISYFSRRIFRMLVERMQLSKLKMIVSEFSIVLLVIGQYFALDSIKWGFITKSFGVLLILVCISSVMETQRNPMKFDVAFMCNQVALFFVIFHTWPILIFVPPAIWVYLLALRYEVNAERMKLLLPLTVFTIGLLSSFQLALTLLGQYSIVQSDGGKEGLPNALLIIPLGSLFAWKYLHQSRAALAGISSLLVAHLYFGLTATNMGVGGNSSYYPRAILWMAINISLPVFVALCVFISETQYAKLFMGKNFGFTLAIICLSFYISSPSQMIQALSGKATGNPAQLVSFLTSEKINHKGPIVLWVGEGYQQVSASLLQVFRVPTIASWKMLSDDVSVLCDFLKDPPSTGEGFYLITNRQESESAIVAVYTPIPNFKKQIVNSCNLQEENVIVYQIDRMT